MAFKVLEEKQKIERIKQLVEQLPEVEPEPEELEGLEEPDEYVELSPTLRAKLLAGKR